MSGERDCEADFAHCSSFSPDVLPSPNLYNGEYSCLLIDFRVAGWLQYVKKEVENLPRKKAALLEAVDCHAQVPSQGGRIVPDRVDVVYAVIENHKPVQSDATIVLVQATKTFWCFSTMAEVEGPMLCKDATQPIGLPRHLLLGKEWPGAR